jgi:hypothetical protein
MNVAFNEISIRPFAESSHELKAHFINLGKTLKTLKNDYGVGHLIFPSNLSEIEVLPNVNIHQWLSELSGLQKQQIVTLISKKPFSNEVLESFDEEIDSYIFDNEDLGIKEDICIGLGLADICQTASVSLNTDDFWQNDEIPFNILDYNTEERTPVTVPNCCLEGLTAEFKKWIEDNVDVALVTTDAEPTTKSISLREDHGKDILTALAKRIRTSGHVISIVNSLPFNPTTSRFIRKCYSDGKVEIVLHWEDKGIGMIVQTTGRTYNETVAIAEILKEKYDR